MRIFEIYLRTFRAEVRIIFSKKTRSFNTNPILGCDADNVESIRRTNFGPNKRSRHQVHPTNVEPIKRNFLADELQTVPLPNFGFEELETDGLIEEEV